jgi:hypothetical protein
VCGRAGGLMGVGCHKWPFLAAACCVLLVLETVLLLLRISALACNGQELSLNFGLCCPAGSASVLCAGVLSQ